MARALTVKGGGLETTLLSLRALGIRADEVDMALLTIAVNALSSLEERQPRYAVAIRAVLAIAGGEG